MTIADKDTVLINNLYLTKGWVTRKMLNDFLTKAGN